MSRTNRKTFYDIHPDRRIRDSEDWWFYCGRDKERDRYFNGRDGVRGVYDEPCSKSPKGHCSWCDRDSPNSRWCKRGAARVIRNRYKKIIREEIRLLDVGDDEVVYVKTNGKKTMSKEQRWEIRREKYIRTSGRSNYQSPEPSRERAKNLFQRVRLSETVKELTSQIEQLSKVRVHRSLLSSLTEEMRELEEKRSRLLIKIRSIR